MSGRKVARLGDVSDHGGVIVEASEDVTANSRGVARVGDAHDCPLHGVTPIATGSPNITANSRRVARVGDVAGCGAVIVTGSPDTFAN